MPIAIFTPGSYTALQAMVHFRMTPERLPRKVGAYPRVVQGLYEEWTGEGERGGEKRVRDKDW